MQESLHVGPLPIPRWQPVDRGAMPQVMQAGAYGVAMIRAVLAAPDPYQATQQLRAALAAAGQV